MNPKICIYGNYVLDRIFYKGIFLGERIGGGIYYSSLPLIEEGLKPKLYTVLNPITSSQLSSNNMLEYVTPVDHDKLPNIFNLYYINDRRIITVEYLTKKINKSYDACEYTILNPVLDEIPLYILKIHRVNNKLLVGDIQGFIRMIDEHGRITYKSIEEVLEIFNYLDIVHMSIDEALTITHGELNLLTRITQYSKTCIVVTRGVEPPLIISNNKISTTRNNECEKISGETTGAGDYFLAKLLINYINTWSIDYAVEKAFIETCKWVERRASSRYTAR